MDWKQKTPEMEEHYDLSGRTFWLAVFRSSFGRDFIASWGERRGPPLLRGNINDPDEAKREALKAVRDQLAAMLVEVDGVIAEMPDGVTT